MKKSILIVNSLILLGFTISCNEPQKEEAKQVQVEESNVPHSEKSEVKKLAYSVSDNNNGKLQSPINIISNQSEEEKHENLVFGIKDEINKIENLGHTVQLDFKEGNIITENDKSYEIKQVHFHTPSEHLIDGITYPMEMHMVSTLMNQEEGETTQYLVTSILFKEGESNKFIDEFINQVPKEEHETKDVELGAINISDISTNNFIDELNSFYHYSGSLTTPPYTETVDWHVPKTIFEASQEQIQAINKIEGNNARHIQDLYGRLVKYE